MELTQREISDVVVLRISGKLMGGPDAALLNDKLHELSDAGKYKVVVDLSEVDMMNSTGLGLLIGGRTIMQNQGGDLKLASLSDRLRTLLTISKLNTVFEIFDDVEAAVASYSN